MSAAQRKGTAPAKSALRDAIGHRSDKITIGAETGLMRDGQRAESSIAKASRSLPASPKGKGDTALSCELSTKYRVALLLQGGGSLGAYQAGVYQAMHESGIAPDWILGTSIGAINGALIAGNAPDQRIAKLKAFWNRVSHRDFIDPWQLPDAARQWNTALTTWNTFLRGAPGFFKTRPFNPFAAGLPVTPEQASFYDTTPLVKTLAELIDTDQLNADMGTRLTVNATSVTTGEQTSFDTQKQRIGIEHIMASGALPPGLPPVRVGGELFWDGGLYSNTPLETVLEDDVQTNTICFMVDLWSPTGPEPTTFDAVQTRQKDITYASRSQQHIDDYLRLHRLRRTLRELYQRMPEDQRSEAEHQALVELGCETTIHVVRLVYGGMDWGMAAKDANFSAGSIEWRWELGYRTAQRALAHKDWLSIPLSDEGVVIHEVSTEHGASIDYR